MRSEYNLTQCMLHIIDAKTTPKHKNIYLKCTLLETTRQSYATASPLLAFTCPWTYCSWMGLYNILIANLLISRHKVLPYMYEAKHAILYQIQNVTFIIRPAHEFVLCCSDVYWSWDKIQLYPYLNKKLQ